eukprot:TRINITY_DN6926_c0_g1_i1.p1 TRINITY_DN6926_c0_g1~~TRINITY_DN6926_c0_g1_i1.p1  ORF type:complete len:914 (-),score=97.58 TRINITY_DN6926_c0_g1_i1:66-2807(-)
MKAKLVLRPHVIHNPFLLVCIVLCCATIVLASRFSRPATPATAFTSPAAASDPNPCLGAYQWCPATGECVMLGSDCGCCCHGYGQYLCPDRRTCASSAQQYLDCPGLNGTLWDWNLPAEARVEWLATNTNLSEKISQLTNAAPALPRFGIPAYDYGSEALHGVCTLGATSFPNGCGLGAMWSKERMAEVGRAIGIEARGKHNGYVKNGLRLNQMGLNFFTPNINLVKDPRWGRNEEVYSEDPYLTSRLAVAYVRGMQQGPDDSHLLAGCCCKHFAAYDVENLPNGTQRYEFNAIVDTRNMWETYMPAFRACVVEAQASAVMCSYNSLNGVPTCGDKNLLTGILRNQWAWPGYVVSDYDAVANIFGTHHYTKTMDEAVALAMNSGCDQEGGGDENVRLNHLVPEHKVSIDQITESFRRLVMLRVRLGMFDPPTYVQYNYLTNNTSVVESPQHVALARYVARESIVMYRNNRATLPLNPATLGRVAVIGPAAAAKLLLLSNYNGYPTKIVSIVEGIASALNFTIQKPAGDNAELCTFENNMDYYIPDQEADMYVQSTQKCCELCAQSPGCRLFTYNEGWCWLRPSVGQKKPTANFTSGYCNRPVENKRLVYAPGCATPSCPDQSLFPEAIAAAKSADATILVLGLDQYLETEGNDRTSLDLPTNQIALLKLLRAATPGKPLIGVLVHGGSLTFHGAEEHMDALIDAWYPGMEGGNAVADVLFGAYSPAGRTAVTWYTDVADLPSMASMNMYDFKGRTYRFFNGTVKYPFGYGLSYTTFQYSQLAISPSNDAVDVCTRVSVRVTVTNSGQHDSDEVVQLYVVKEGSTVPSPNIRLADFTRIHVRAGQSARVSLVIEPEQHSVVYNTTNVFDERQAVMVERGILRIYVGGGQPGHTDSVVEGQVQFTGTTRPLYECY